MHVVLTILKIIGIILLVILGILLLIFLALLFVPLRYQAHVRKEEKDLEADGRLTWLLHLLRMDMTIRDLKGTLVIRACGFRLKTIHFLKKDEEAEKAPEKETAKREAVEREAAEKEAAVEKTAEKESSKETRADGHSGIQVKSVEEKAAEKVSTEETGERVFAQKASAAGEETKTSRFKKQKKSAKSKTSKKKPLHNGPAGKIVKLFAQLVNTALDLLIQVPGLPAEAYDKIDKVQKMLYDKYDAIYRKVEPFLSVEAEHVCERCIRYLKYLIRGYAPRKIYGYLHFGTGAPDLTGELTGLVYMLLPEAGTEYEVAPDFYETVLETDTYVRGHIRMYRAVWVAIRLLLDKEVRILYRKIRGKEKTAKPKRQRRREKAA